MEKIKGFKDWLSEEFATVGVSPAGNVAGMGNVAAPTSTATGSGDAWPALLMGKKPRKRRRKKLKSKVAE